jgi:hypothetical protein
MGIVRGLWFFYKKLILAAFLFSVFLAVVNSRHIEFFMGVGFSFIFLMPMFHYLSYEVNSPGEYYFYYNLGLSRLVLWLCTIAMSLIIGLSIILL